MNVFVSSGSVSSAFLLAIKVISRKLVTAVDEIDVVPVESVSKIEEVTPDNGASAIGPNGVHTG